MRIFQNIKVVWDRKYEIDEIAGTTRKWLKIS